MGNRVREFRQSNGVPLARLAINIGVGEIELARIERSTTLQISVLRQLAAALGCATVDLLPERDKAELSSEERQIVQLIRSLPQPHRSRAIAVMQALTASPATCDPPQAVAINSD